MQSYQKAVFTWNHIHTNRLKNILEKPDGAGSEEVQDMVKELLARRSEESRQAKRSASPQKRG